MLPRNEHVSTLISKLYAFEIGPCFPRSNKSFEQHYAQAWCVRPDPAICSAIGWGASHFKPAAYLDHFTRLAGIVTDKSWDHATKHFFLVDKADGRPSRGLLASKWFICQLGDRSIQSKPAILSDQMCCTAPAMTNNPFFFFFLFFFLFFFF